MASVNKEAYLTGRRRQKNDQVLEDRLMCLQKLRHKNKFLIDSFNISSKYSWI